MNTFYKRPAMSPLLVVTVCFLLMFSCSRRESVPVRTAEEIQLLLRINDSVGTLAPSARQLLDSALASARDSFGYYECLVMKGRHCLMATKPDSALKLSELILHFAQRQPVTPRTKGLQALAYCLQANYWYLFHQKQDLVLRLYNDAYRLLLESDIPERAPDIGANIGDVYMQLSKLPDAAAWYRRALVLVDSLQLPEERNATLYMGLGHIYCMLKDYKQAEMFYARTEKGFQFLEANMKVSFLNNYGNLKYYEEDYEGALRVFSRLDTLIDALDLRGTFDDYLCKLNTADVLLNLGKTKQSLECLAPADSFFRKAGVGDALYYANTIRIGNALNMGNTALASSIIENEPDGLTTDEGLRGIRSNYLYKYYMKTGDYRSAVHQLKANLQREDSIDASREHMRAVDIMARFRADTLDLHHQLRIGEANMQRSHDWLVFTAVAALLLAVLLMLMVWLHYLRRRNAMNHQEIVALKIQNSRNSISPHFIYNVLSRYTDAQQSKAGAEAMNNLIDLMRTNVSMSRQALVTLQQELDFTRSYVHVVSPMLSGGLQFEVEMPEDEGVAQRNLPATFVQILVENAVKHGFADIPSPKRIDISVQATEHETIITVADNGRGFDIRRVSQQGSGTGLSVIRRIVALHNSNNRQKMNFSIENILKEDGQTAGCRATLTIPAQL